MTISELKQQQTEKHTALFKECKLFFAFSNEQFAENKTPLETGEKYVSIGAGGYLPKSQYAKLQQGMKDIKKWYKANIKEFKDLRRQNIAYELSNYECYCTGDIDPAIEALGAGYTRKEIYKVYSEEREKQKQYA